MGSKKLRWFFKSKTQELFELLKANLTFMETWFNQRYSFVCVWEGVCMFVQNIAWNIPLSEWKWCNLNKMWNNSTSCPSGQLPLVKNRKEMENTHYTNTAEVQAVAYPFTSWQSRGLAERGQEEEEENEQH